MNKTSYWDAKCRHVSNCCIAALWLYSKDYRAFTETIPCHKNVADRPRSGRSHVTTATVDRYIVLQHLRNRPLTAAATGRQYGIHPQTVRNWLRQNVQPIRAYRPYFGQILTRRHRTARRDWCRHHLHFRRADCDLILFSDECRFNLSHAEGRERVYHRRVERFANACVNERDHFGGVTIFV